MNLIQRYLFRQIGLPILAACGALAGIGLLSQTLDQLEVIVERGQSIWIMLKLTFLALPQLIAVILPIGLFVGAVISLTRLQREQELTAAFASGMKRWSVIRPAAQLALIVMAITLLSTVVLQPWAQRTARDQAFAIRTDLAVLLVEEGRFVQGSNGLTVYVQQIEQSGLLKNLFIYIEDDKSNQTWNAAEARFGKIDGATILTMINGSWQRYSSNGVLEQLSFDNNTFDLSPFDNTVQSVRYKASDLWLTDLFNPSPGLLQESGTRAELAAEGHSRLSSPLYALTGMALALAAILGGTFSRTGYTGRIAKAAAIFLVVRIAGYGLVSASAWNGGLNGLQYLLPIIVTALALRLLFRALKPRRGRRWYFTRLIGPRTA